MSIDTGCHAMIFEQFQTDLHLQSRLSNVYIPEDQKKEEEVTGRDLQSDAEAAVNLTEEEEQLLLKVGGIKFWLLQNAELKYKI